MNLYEINSQILDCIDQETGEVMDIDRLEELNMAKAEKVDNIACWVKNLEADVAAFEAQEKAFADRKAAAKRKIDSLKHYLTDAPYTRWCSRQHRRPIGALHWLFPALRGRRQLCTERGHQRLGEWKSPSVEQG